MQLAKAIILLALAQVVTPALAAEWTIDGKHSAADFKIRHMMVSNVRGAVSGATGTVNYDPKKPKETSVDAELDVATINTNEPARDEHLRGAEFFDVKKFPKMTFKSKKVTSATANKISLLGDLTMHGITKEVTLNVDGPTPVSKEASGKERMGATATTKVNRKDFGIQYNKQLDNGGVALGEDVDITIELELGRDGQPAVKKADKKAAK